MSQSFADGFFAVVAVFVGAAEFKKIHFVSFLAQLAQLYI